jgi:predicted PurR-regulated permease PerM
VKFFAARRRAQTASEPVREEKPTVAPVAVAPSGPEVPAWLRNAAAVSWRLLVVAGAISAVLYLLAHLRVIVLPVIIALLVTTLLLPPARWLRRRGLSNALAAALVMVGSIVALGLVIAAVAPSVAGQTDELGTGIEDGIQQASDVLAEPPFNLSETEIKKRVEEGIDRLQEDSGPVTEGVQSGAIIFGEIVTGLIITLLLTFFFLKDGRQMWDWLVGLFGPTRRKHFDEVGTRVFDALSGYVRGIALVGLVDALLIGLALLVLGVPLVVPLMLLTFFGAFLPLIGAFLAGLAAVMIALVSGGLVTALLILGAVVLVQQIEGHLLYPLLMGRTVHLHPAVIILSLGVGGILAGIIGVFLAVPVAGSLSVVLDFARNRPAPESPVVGEPATS